jgi:hypothetical protein
VALGITEFPGPIGSSASRNSSPGPDKVINYLKNSSVSASAFSAHGYNPTVISANATDLASGFRRITKNHQHRGRFLGFDQSAPCIACSMLGNWIIAMIRRIISWPMAVVRKYLKKMPQGYVQTDRGGKFCQ